MVVDVRGWFEYFMGHIAGAKRMSRDRILKEIPQRSSDRDYLPIWTSQRYGGAMVSCSGL